jgi:hypothetical protein
MTVKKTLQNRIRGWFPQEPCIVNTRLKVNHENKQPPLIIPSEYKVSATKYAGVFAIFWITFSVFMFFNFVNLERYPISAFQFVAWIIAGLTVGAITVAMFTKNQLSRLLKDYQFTTNGKDLVLLIVPTVLFFIFGFFVNWSIYGAMRVPILQGFWISAIAWGISIEITRVILFGVFEKKENMRLMQSWWGPGIILVPKAPINNVNRSETTTTRESSSLTGSGLKHEAQKKCRKTFQGLASERAFPIEQPKR